MKKIMTKNGFTLIELLVTTTMLAVLTLIGVVSYSSVNKRSRDVKRKSDMEQVRSALEMYRSDNGSYPPGTVADPTVALSINDPDSGIQTLKTAGYLPSLPSDPSRESTYPYLYYLTNLSNGNYYGYCICSCLESAACPAVDPTGNCTQASCNYYLRNP